MSTLKFEWVEKKNAANGRKHGISFAEAKNENFPIRNRTMALLTDATVIVQAGETSGALLQGGRRYASAGCSSYSKVLLPIQHSRGRKK